MSETSSNAVVPVRCVRCDHPLDSPIGCQHCHAIFPAPSDLSHFDRLGLPGTFRISDEDLERRFLAWSRELHPDFFQLRSEDDRTLSLSLSASLNDAYATLSDPFRRAEYLLSLRGGPSASEHRTMPPEFLEEILETRGQIEEIREAGESASAEARTLGEQIAADRRAAMQQVGELFDRIESLADPEPNDPLILEIRERLNTVKYLDGLLRDLQE